MGEILHPCHPLCPETRLPDLTCHPGPHLPLPSPAHSPGSRPGLHTLGSQLQGVFGKSGHLLVGRVSTGGSSPVMSNAGRAPTPEPGKCKLPKLSCSSAKNRCKPRSPEALPSQGSSNLVPNHLSTCWPHTQAQSLPLEAEMAKGLICVSLSHWGRLGAHSSFSSLLFFFFNFLGCAARLWDLPHQRLNTRPCTGNSDS